MYDEARVRGMYCQMDMRSSVLVYLVLEMFFNRLRGPLLCEDD
jgi:hypothetical protein